jgi:DNA-binding transcriptional regulator YiaG
MEQFMQQVRAYADALNIHPSTVIQRAANGGGNSWPKWESGKSSPTLKTADKILKYIAENPVLADDADAEPLKAVG